MKIPQILTLIPRTPDKQKRKGGTECPKLAKSCRYLACLHRTHF